LIQLAKEAPGRPAVIIGDGSYVESFGELEARSRRVAHALRSRGLREGDSACVLLGNVEEFFDVYWATQRLGLYFTPVNWHLAADEIRYIFQNSDADCVIASAHFGEVVAEAAGSLPGLGNRISLHGEIDGFEPYEDLVSSAPSDAALPDQRGGSVMLYSSGTTGFPKGVRNPLPMRDYEEPSLDLLAQAFAAMFGFQAGDVYLSPAPLYHAAPLRFCDSQHRLGCTTVVMPRFDAEAALAAIQGQGVTTSQWVPTHFKRLLQLPEDVRARYDVSSLRVAVHAAAPCPIPVKREMIEWWGPVLQEYYAGTEGGGTLIDSEDWLAHPGSVGRPWPGSEVVIFDEAGDPIQEPGGEGAIYFRAAGAPESRFRYHKDEEKTRDTWRGDCFTLGDVGYLDAEGYLFLTDRKSHMIISGGVNIYPQETENCLVAHPKVHDVGVIGVPDEEMGEQVKAVVIPAAGFDPGPELERELVDYTRAQIAHYKCPRSVDFVEELPRTETGKLQKKKLRARYWDGREAQFG